MLNHNLLIQAVIVKVKNPTLVRVTKQNAYKRNNGLKTW